MLSARAEGVGFEPTVGMTHTRFPSVPIRPLSHPSLGGVPGAAHAIVCRARDRRWRPGPVQPQPVNRVRAGRQQLSAEPVVCRRPPGRHLR